MITYEVIYSKRKTLAVQVTAEGKVVVRAPWRYPAGSIRNFVETHADWIKKQQEAGRHRQEFWSQVTPEVEKACRKKARQVFPEKVAYYAEQMGVTYGRISVRGQKTRWGSCSRDGNLNFNWKLMLFPERIQDYVVVHELAHRKEMNHSPAFYRCVEEIFPDYRACIRWLKENA